ncbi:MAG: arginyltransferase [Sedimenticola sp.]|nr:arginyltransferase [Sedimenticola sp.]
MTGSFNHSQRVLLYLSGDHPCSYIDQQAARTLFVDPQQQHKRAIYNSLINQGFRRSGEMIYRPDCANCKACISLRLPVEQFKSRRIQRRVWNRLHDRFQITEHPATFDTDHFNLFKRYLAARHQDGEMASMTESDYLNFIGSDWADTRIFAFHQDDVLAAAAITDLLQDGLSAVYTFFDPDLEQLSVGTFSILWQIEACKKRNLPWLYLGYWIDGCQKMAYKNQYHPHEAYINGQWLSEQAVETLELNAN